MHVDRHGAFANAQPLTYFSVAKTLEQTYRPSEVIGFRPVPVLTRTWSVEVDEAGNRRLVAHWTQAR